MKKIISLLVVISICLSLCILNVSAETQCSRNDKIISALQATECIKNDIGLGNVNFQELEIASVIKTYEYTKNGFVESYDFYPLLINGKLMAFAVEYQIDNKNQYQYQITTELIEELDGVISNNTNFAIIYDADSCYVYDGEILSFLKKSNKQYESRAIITPFSIPTSINQLKLNSITDIEPLEYNSILSARIPVYYECDVDYVMQGYNEKICWAASVACIANYLNGTNLIAIDVARAYYGATNFNRTLPRNNTPNVLAMYSISYTFRNQIPSDNIILTNIQRGYPVFVHLNVDNESDGHAGVAYGYNMSLPYLYIMDPTEGTFVASYSNGTYSYVKDDRVYILAAATCKYWS